MIRPQTKLALLCALVLTQACVSGCATIFSGTKDAVLFDSEPRGATIKINGIDVGATPALITLPRESDSPKVELSKPGFEPTNFEVTSTFNTMALYNTIFLPAWILDMKSGALHHFEQQYYSFKLSEAPDPQPHK